MLDRASTLLRRLHTRPATREDRNIRRLMAHTGLFGIVQGGVITFLPVLLARLGASATMVSLLTSLPALLTIVLALPAGEMVARWRNIVRDSARCFYAIRLSYPPIAAAAALLGPSAAPVLIVILWGLTAIPGTLGNTVFYDVLAEAVPPRRRAAVNGVRWALLGLVSAASVALFGQMLEALPWPHNYTLLFAICFVAGLLSTYCYSRIEIAAREPDLSARPALRPASLLGPLRQPGFAVFSLVTLVMRWGLFLPAGVFTIFLVRNLRASDAWIGERTTLENGALTAGYYVWGRLANRLGPFRMLAMANVAVGSAFCLAGLASAETRWLLFIGAMIGGFFVSAVDVSLFEWLLAVMPADERPRYVAVNTLLLNVVAFLAPLTGAAIARWAGIPVVLFAAAGCLFISAALTLRLQARPIAAPRPAPAPEA